MIVTKKIFSELAGVGRASVTLSVQRGKLIETKDGYIDTEDQTNKAYLSGRGEKANPKALTIKTAPVKKQPPSKKEKLKKERVIKTNLDHLDGVELPEPEIQESDFEEGDVDQMAKLAVDIRLKMAQAKRHELKFEQDKGFLIPVEAVEKAAAKIGTEIKTRLQDLPRRISPRIISMAKSGATEREIQDVMEKEIDDGIDFVRNLLGAEIV